MEFRKITSPGPVVDYLVDTLRNQLQADKKVVWLVPGGSSIPIAAEASRRLEGMRLHNLSITLTDERYGPVGHADSNWVQLAEAGFNMDDAAMLPVLNGKDRDAVTAEFADALQKLFDKTDFMLGFFGIGADGHTAGILPDSVAVNADDLAASYSGEDFERITMTPVAIARLDEAVVYAKGDAKRPVLDGLEKDLPLSQQPAQALKQVSKVTIFNDYKGEPT